MRGRRTPLACHVDDHSGWASEDASGRNPVATIMFDRYHHRMKVLLTNSRMDYLGGTQRWVGTVGEELERRGATVRILSSFNKLYPWIAPHTSGDRYDLALINHNGPFKESRKIQIRKRIYTVHGFVPAEEWAPPGADAYVAVSELAAAHLPWGATIIRNPIDVSLFRPGPPISADLKRVLFLSNRQGRARTILEDACRLAGVELRVIGKKSAVDDPWNAINWADVVVAIGRGVLEGLACNRNVFALDHYGAKGYVTPESFARYRLDNFAGHLDSYWPNPQELAEALIGGYRPTMEMRAQIAKEHSPAAVVDKYLSVAEGIGIPRRLATGLYRGAGGAFVSPRVTKALSYVGLGQPREALEALKGSQKTPPLIAAKLPPGVELTYQTP